MNRNQVRTNQKEVTGLKKQVQKYSSLQTGSSFMGYSKKRHMYIIRTRTK